MLHKAACPSHFQKPAEVTVESQYDGRKETIFGCMVQKQKILLFIGVIFPNKQEYS